MSDPRVRVAAAGSRASGGDYVLYWCQINRRPRDNFALSYAIAEANARRLPCIVLEALRPDYEHASDRLHTFVLEGAKDMAEGLAARGVRHVLFVPRTPDAARGVVGALSKRAAMIVTDDSPTLVAAHVAAAAKRVDCPLVAVDDAIVVPLALFPKEETAARTLRPKMKKLLPDWLKPIDEPDADVAGDPVEIPIAADDPADVRAIVAACAIDHSVPPVEGVTGGASVAEEQLDLFLRRKIGTYDVDRNDPSRDATSGLSPYLHFGMISARRVALAAREHGEGAEAFLEQLLVRRGLAFVFARRNPAPTSYDHAVPAWARRTLAEHAGDPRPAIVEPEALEAAESPDEIWNAAQLELRARGRVHNYLRMLWGKLVMTWMRDPADAHAWLIRNNDRYALDGRDPDGWANIAWCFGLHDRPWPERAIFGKVRTMTSRSAANKLDLDGYLSSARAWRGTVFG